MLHSSGMSARSSNSIVLQECFQHSSMTHNSNYVKGHIYQFNPKNVLFLCRCFPYCLQFKNCAALPIFPLFSHLTTILALLVDKHN